MNESRLRSLYAEGMLRRSAEAQRKCVPVEALERLVEGHRPEDERLRTLDHVMECEACEREFELLRSVHGSEPEPARRHPWYRPALPLAASFALLLGAALIWRETIGRRADEPIRDGPATAVALLSPTGEIRPEGPLMFVWRAVPGAERYVAEVLTTGGRLVYSLATKDTSFALPDSVRLSAGAEYGWWVQVSLADGDQVRSDLRDFILKSP